MGKIVNILHKGKTDQIDHVETLFLTLIIMI